METGARSGLRETPRGTPDPLVRCGVVEVHEGARALDELAPEWETLADRVRAPVWLRVSWVRAWWRAFARGSLRVFAVRRDGQLTAVAPLELQYGDLRSTSNYHSPSFGLVAQDEEARNLLASALVASAPRRLSIRFLPMEEPSLRALLGAARLGARRSVVRVLERCPYLAIQGAWTVFLRSRGAKLSRGIRRRLRKLAARGHLELDVRDGREDLDRLLEEGFDVEGKGWKGEKGTAIRSQPATRTFYTEVARSFASRGVLRLSFLRLDGVPIAFDFAVEEGGRHLLLKTGYDEAFGPEAPGVLLRAAMIERAFQRGLTRYDFLGKDDPWKLDWTSTVEPQVQFQSFQRSPAAIADWAAQRYLRPLARRILRKR